MATENTADTPSANQRKKKRGATILSWICLILILGGYFVLLLRNVAPATAHPDANGYWAQGSLLFTTGRTWFAPEADAQYIGIHWLLTESGRYICRYPPGLPVLVGLVYTALGATATFLINPVLATLSLLGLYLIIRRMAGDGWALVGVVVLGLNQPFNEHALGCISHMAVAFCLVWGVFLLLLWSENGRLWQIFAAGVMLGCIPTIRYPEGLFAVGAGVFLLWHVRSHERIWRHYLAAIAGAALPLVPLLIRNHLVLGAFWRTGYYLTNEQTGFGWDYFKDHYIDYVQNLHASGIGLFFALGILGMVAMCFVRRLRRIGVLLLLLIIPSTLLYMSYYWGMGGRSQATLRFLVPTFPCYIIAGAWLLHRLTEQGSMFLKSSIAAVIIALQLLWGGGTVVDARQSYQKEALARVADGLEQHVGHGDVVMAQSQILQYLDFLRHWRLADPSVLRESRRRQRMRRDQDPDRPSPRQVKKDELREEKYRGLSADEREELVAADIRRWAGEHKVYYVGTERQIEDLRGPCLNADQLKIIARVPLPERPAAPERDSRSSRGFDRFRGARPGDRDAPGGARMPFDRRWRDGGRGQFGPMGMRDGDARRMFARFGRRAFGRGGGGFMGRGFSAEDKEVVIAEWLYRLPETSREE